MHAGGGHTVKLNCYFHHNNACSYCIWPKLPYFFFVAMKNFKTVFWEVQLMLLFFFEQKNKRTKMRILNFIFVDYKTSEKRREKLISIFASLARAFDVVSGAHTQNTHPRRRLPRAYILYSENKVKTQNPHTHTDRKQACPASVGSLNLRARGRGWQNDEF